MADLKLNLMVDKVATPMDAQAIAGMGFWPANFTTAARNALVTPPAGFTIYNTTTNKLNMYNGTAWEVVTSA